MKPGRSYLYQAATVPIALYESVDLIDRTLVAAAEIDAKRARQIVVEAAQQPFGARRVLVIDGADILSEQVQNTLLKLLEEPPHFLIVILATPHPSLLLPTVRSRLHPIPAEPSLVDKPARERRELPTESVLGGQLTGTKDRAALVALLEDLRQDAADAMLETPTANLIRAVDLLDRSIRRLGQNANQKLVIDALLLNWPL